MVVRLLLWILEWLYGWSGRLLSKMAPDRHAVLRSSFVDRESAPPKHWADLVRHRVPQLLDIRNDASFSVTEPPSHSAPSRSR